jgi:hypothetical protein
MEMLRASPLERIMSPPFVVFIALAKVIERQGQDALRRLLQRAVKNLVDLMPDG